MAKFVSSKNPVSVASLKRRVVGAVVVRHGYEDVRFVRVHGGWLRSREDFAGLSPEVVSSATVARECNSATGLLVAGSHGLGFTKTAHSSNSGARKPRTCATDSTCVALTER